ncbi:hypothetical protein [Streptomyces vilmorinianum]|uniref:hypothetical protein n=1 Tax=Streptomyces vilmorinianum TaxID=3051092 RepID=UPI0032E7F7B6
MSGSLWLKNGSMRDTLPVIPRPRGGAGPGARREGCAAPDAHGPTPAVPDAPRASARPAHGPTPAVPDAPRASARPAHGPTPAVPDAPRASARPAHGPTPAVPDAPRASARAAHGPAASHGACACCADGPGAGRPAGAVASPRAAECRPPHPLRTAEAGPARCVSGEGPQGWCAATHAAPGRCGGRGSLSAGPGRPDAPSAADGPRRTDGATTDAGACTTCAPDLVPGPHGPLAPDPVPGPHGPLAPDPLDELADRLHALAADAVHPDEIAAILESDGMTDDHIRLTYGRADSFALAEELYARVERRHPAPEAPPAGPWHTGLAGCLLRGLVFALPGLAYVLGAPLLGGPATAPLLAGAVAGWVWNQALSHRAYSWLGLGDRGAAARALLVGAPAGALVGSTVAFAAADPGEWPVVVFAAGQSLYLGAATVLLVLGRERALLCALLPLAGAVPAFRYDLPDPLRAALLILSLTATVAFASIVLRPAGRRPRSGPPLAASLPYGLFGLGSGLLVLYAGAGDALVTGAAPVVALTLSMGPAEWLLHRFRSESLAGLRTLTSAHAFRWAAVGTLARCLGAYLAVLLALASVGTLLWPGAPALDGIRLLGLLLVGIVLWLGLLLQAFGAVRGAATVCTLAAAAQTLTPASGPAVAATAAAVLTVLACALLARPTAHRA